MHSNGLHRTACPGWTPSMRCRRRGGRACVRGESQVGRGSPRCAAPARAGRRRPGSPPPGSAWAAACPSAARPRTGWAPAARRAAGWWCAAPPPCPGTRTGGPRRPAQGHTLRGRNPSVVRQGRRLRDQHRHLPHAARQPSSKRPGRCAAGLFCECAPRAHAHRTGAPGWPPAAACTPRQCAAAGSPSQCNLRAAAAAAHGAWCMPLWRAVAVAVEGRATPAPRQALVGTDSCRAAPLRCGPALLWVRIAVAPSTDP